MTAKEGRGVHGGAGEDERGQRDGEGGGGGGGGRLHG